MKTSYACQQPWDVYVRVYKQSSYPLEATITIYLGQQQLAKLRDIEAMYMHAAM
jgi:hypothetical protein